MLAANWKLVVTPPVIIPQLCLELLLTMALRNRDRAGLLWPLLHDALAGVMGAEATTTPGVWPAQISAFWHHQGF